MKSEVNLSEYYLAQPVVASAGEDVRGLVHEADGVDVVLVRSDAAGLVARLSVVQVEVAVICPAQQLPPVRTEANTEDAELLVVRAAKIIYNIWIFFLKIINLRGRVSCLSSPTRETWWRLSDQEEYTRWVPSGLTATSRMDQPTSCASIVCNRLVHQPSTSMASRNSKETPGLEFQSDAKDFMRLWLANTPLEPLKPHFICRHNKIVNSTG